MAARSRPWLGSPLSLLIGTGELFNQELNTLVAIATMGKAGMGHKTDHGLIDLHALWGFRTIGRHCAFGALGGDGARAIRNN